MTRLWVPLLALAVVGAACSAVREVVATVDGVDIGEERFLDELEQFAGNEEFRRLTAEGLDWGSEGTAPAALVADWLNRQIVQVIVDREVGRREVEVTDAQVDAARNAVTQTFAGEAVLDGFDTWFRERLVESDARFIALAEAVGGRVTEADVQAAYEARRSELETACASHILVETREEADEVKGLLDGGADFAALARERSTDTGTAEQGGDLGCNPRGAFVPAFEDAVFSLPVGVVSDPVETAFGFHLVLVASRGTAAFEEVRAQIQADLEAEANEALGAFLFEAIGEADVEVNPKYGTFAVTPQGSQVIPPEAPAPADRLPVGDTGGQEGPLVPFAPQP